MVRDQAVVRLAGPGAADQGAGRRGVAAPARVRRRARRGPDDRGRAAADAAADGARGQGPGHRPVPVGGLHLGERGARGAGTIRGVRPGRPGVRRREGRRRRRADGGVAARVRHPAGPGAGGRPVGRGPGRGLAAVRRPARPDQPGAAAARGHRDRDAAGAADRPRLGGRGRDRVPHGARGAAARAGPRGHQGRRLRRRAVHLVLHRAEPGRHRGQAARGHGDRGHRPADRQDRGRVRAARRRDRAQAVDGGAGRRPGRVRRRPAGRGQQAGEPVRRPSERRRGARRRLR